MKIRVLEIADKELSETFRYYENEQAELGHRFIAEFAQSIRRIVAFPKSYQLIGERARRCLVSEFPYGVLYHYNEPDAEILVVAVGHLHRGPDYWLSR